MGRIIIILLMTIISIPYLYILNPKFSEELSIQKNSIFTLDTIKIPIDTEDAIKSEDALKDEDKIDVDKYITPMKALDLVQERFARNFIKTSLQEKQEDYFYKLDIADYYLVYEDTDDITGYHLIHLYEFVIDDEETGIGHTVTYGWYWVDPSTGEIQVYPEP